MNSFPPPSYQWKLVRSVASLDELPYIKLEYKIHMDAHTFCQRRWRFRCSYKDRHNPRCCCPFKMYLVPNTNAFDLFACGYHEHKKSVSEVDPVAKEKSEYDISLDKSSFVRYLTSNKSFFQKKIPEEFVKKRVQDTFALIKLVKAETFLYDESIKGNREGIKYVWQRISNSLTFYNDVRSALAKWRNLVRYLKKELTKMCRKLRETGEMCRKSTWLYYDSMEWLIEHLPPRYRKMTSIRSISSLSEKGDKICGADMLQVLDWCGDKDGLTSSRKIRTMPSSEVEENHQSDYNGEDKSETREWLFLRNVANETELEEVRREMKLTVKSKTYNGAKITYRCSASKNTGCRYRLCSVERNDSYELFFSGKHNHLHKKKLLLKDIKPSNTKNNKKKRKRVKFDLSANVTKSFDPKNKEESSQEVKNSNSLELIANRFIPDVNSPHKWKFFSVYTASEWPSAEKFLGLQRKSQSKAIEFGICKSMCRCKHYSTTKCPYKMCLLWDTKTEMYGLFEAVPNVHNHTNDDTSSQKYIVAAKDQKVVFSDSMHEASKQGSSFSPTANSRTNATKPTSNEIKSLSREPINNSRNQSSVNKSNLKIHNTKDNFKSAMSPIKLHDTSLVSDEENAFEKFVVIKDYPDAPPQTWEELDKADSTEKNLKIKNLPAKSIAGEPNTQTEKNLSASVEKITIPAALQIDTYKLSSKVVELKELASQMGLHSSLVRESFYFVPKLGYKKTDDLEGHYLRLTDRNHLIQIIKFENLKLVEEIEFAKAVWEEVFEKIHQLLKEYFSLDMYLKI